MDVRYTFALLAAFAFTANVPGAGWFRAATLASSSHASHSDLADSPTPSNGASAASQQSAKAPAGRLGTQSKLDIIRFLDGEYAKAVVALPRGKDGFTMPVGKPLDSERLHDLVRAQGVAASPGDQVQITSIEFQSRKIVLQINGGSKKHFHLLEHLQIGMGGATAPVATAPHPGEGIGSTLILDYGRPVPEMSPEELKQQLSPLLSFSGETSAAVNWIDTVPPEFQKAIKDHRAAVGMDEQMVLAALGRPEHKVREHDPEGRETEDWIYGDPPAKTTFVTLMSGKVIKVEVFE